MALCSVLCISCVSRREAAAVNANRQVRKLKDELEEVGTRATEVTQVGEGLLLNTLIEGASYLIFAVNSFLKILKN